MGKVVDFPQPRAAMTVEDHIRGLGDRLQEETASATYFANAIVNCVRHGLTPTAFLKEADAYLNGQVPVERFKNGLPVE